MSDNAVRTAMLALVGLTIAVLGSLVALGHNSAVTDGLLACCGGVGSLAIWERLKK